MTDLGMEPCDFCGTEKASNLRISYDWTVTYEDGDPRASIPGIVLCYDCAEEVSDYFRERSGGWGDVPEGLAPFGEADAEALLDRLMENKHLVLDTETSGYGIRVDEGEWKRAIIRLPGPPTIEILDRTEVKTIILDAKRLTLKHLDPAAWKRFARDYQRD